MQTNKSMASRRTVLKTTGLLAGAVLAGGVGTAAASATRGTFDAGEGRARGRAHVVRIVAQHDHDTHEHALDFSTTEFPAGWTTFELENPTEHTHFVYFAKVPQAAIDEADDAQMDVLDYYYEQVTKPFQGFMDYLAGEKPRHPIVFPEWFGDVLANGGPGMTSPGEVARTTLDIAPGTYVAECYVKDDHNEFHSYSGMLELFTVTEGAAGTEPRPTLDVSVSKSGIVVSGDPRPGRHLIGVTFDDMQVYDNLVGHDVHLLRFDDDTTQDNLNAWMDWRDPEVGLISDGSEPGTFLGGANEIVTSGTETATSYVDVVLKPGRYALVAEVPDPVGKGLYAEFHVPSGRPGAID